MRSRQINILLNIIYNYPGKINDALTYFRRPSKTIFGSEIKHYSFRIIMRIINVVHGITSLLTKMVSCETFKL